MKSGKMHEMGHTSNSEFHAFPLKQWTEMTHNRRLIKCHNSLDNCHRMMIQVSQKLCVIGKLKKRAIQIIYLYTISLMIVLHNKGVSKERCGPGPSRGWKIISRVLPILVTSNRNPFQTIACET
jgi:hypothetical protein